MRNVMTILSLSGLLFASCHASKASEGTSSNALEGGMSTPKIALLCKMGERIGDPAFQYAISFNQARGKAQFEWGEMKPATPSAYFFPGPIRGVASFRRLDLEGPTLKSTFEITDIPQTSDKINIVSIAVDMVMEAPYNKGSATMFLNEDGEERTLEMPSCKFVRVLSE